MLHKLRVFLLVVAGCCLVFSGCSDFLEDQIESKSETEQDKIEAMERTAGFNVLFFNESLEKAYNFLENPDSVSADWDSSCCKTVETMTDNGELGFKFCLRDAAGQPLVNCDPDTAHSLYVNTRLTNTVAEVDFRMEIEIFHPNLNEPSDFEIIGNSSLTRYSNSCSFDTRRGMSLDREKEDNAYPVGNVQMILNNEYIGDIVFDGSRYAIASYDYKGEAHSFQIDIHNGKVNPI